MILFSINENNASYEYVSLYNVPAKINEIFQENPQEDDVLANSLNCLRLIGNINIATEGFEGKPDEEGILELPCCAFEVVYVCDGGLDWFQSTYFNTLSKWHPKGSLVPFEFYGTYIKVPKERYFDQKVTVLYRTALHDEEGFPLITKAESEACAYYWKFIDMKRKFYQGNQIAVNGGLQLATLDKNLKIGQASMPETMTTNFWDQFGNIVMSQDRKVYNYNYKPWHLFG